MSGYSALHESAAWMDVSDRGKIRATGEDRVRFMHAMCSQDIEGLRPGGGGCAFFLNAQGQIQAECRIYVAEDEVWLDTGPGQAERLIEHLEKFIIMDDVTLEDRTASLAMIALEGPCSKEWVVRIFGKAPAEPEGHLDAGGVRIIRSSWTGQPGLWLVTQPEKKDELIAKLEQLGAMAATFEEANVARVENQAPRFGEDYSDSNLPQETQRLEAISFTKGCYLGQEIVERVRSRGQVNRLLVGLEFDAAEPPAAGAAVLFEDREVGRLTSPVFSPMLERALGFGILRREAAGTGKSIRVDGVLGRVRGKQE